MYNITYFATGKSTHNQRIERLWRDVFEGCLCLFYQLFHLLESENLLDPDNEVHLWCLHYVYLPMINRFHNIAQQMKDIQLNSSTIPTYLFKDA